MCSEASLWLTDELLDQVFGFTADFIPLLAIKVKLSLLHHSKDLLVIVTIEGGITAKQNVKHATS